MMRAALGIAGIAALSLGGCAGVGQPAAPVTATAEMKNGGGAVVGVARLSQIGTGVRVVLDVRGLPPGAKGVHVHEAGKCDPSEFTTAGAHFNPDGKKHGLQNAGGPHAGDLPNITIAADGSGRLESMNERVTLGDGTNSLLRPEGTALVIHSAPDDFKTDPTGNSGARIACGVIRKQ
jgi:Cu-Zn family superoxide dismutase